MIESINMVQELFTEIINYVKSYVNPEDSVKIYIDHPNYDGGDIQTRFQKGSDLNPDVVINTITRLAQSGKLLSLDEKLKFNILIIKYKTGSGLKRIADYLQTKQCVVKVKTNEYDKLCGLRAICIGKAYADKENYDIMRDSRNNLQSSKAYELAMKLNFNFNKPLGINEIKKIEIFLKDYQIIVLNGDNANEFDYVGPEKEKKIILYLKDNHYDFIKSIPAFFHKYYFCFK